MRTLSFLVLSLALPCLAADGDWQTVVSGPITVKNRTLEGTGLKEVWAEGEIAAPALDVQAALMDVSRLRFFMPYMKDARELGERLPDGSVYVYTLIDLPVLGKRDYVVRLELKESLAPDGSGAFRNEWHAFPDFTPRRHDIIRLTRDDGSWVVTPREGSKCWAVYRFVVDPGGWVPAFAANLGNERGVKETWDAVEKEALRRRDARLAAH
jgi:hypothetical protein